MAFARLEEGYENAIKDYNKKQVCLPLTPSCSPCCCQRGGGCRQAGKCDVIFLFLTSFLPQITQLNALISLLIGNLSAGDRMKIMTICTIDVHARDVVAKMILTKVEVARWYFHCFLSTSELRSCYYPF